MHGHGLTAVGLVISAHTFGMFALSPLSGRLTDRFGSIRVVVAGLVVVAVSAVLAAAAPTTAARSCSRAVPARLRWNLGYVAGSTMLTTGLPLAERTRIEGVTDSLWSSAAAASLGSGLVVAAAKRVLGLPARRSSSCRSGSCSPGGERSRAIGSA